MKLFESGDIALATNVGDKHIFIFYQNIGFEMWGILFNISPHTLILCI
jgi:hypothetical protein